MEYVQLLVQAINMLILLQVHVQIAQQIVQLVQAEQSVLHVPKDLV